MMINGVSGLTIMKIKSKFTYKTEAAWMLIFGLVGPVIGISVVIITWILNFLNDLKQDIK